MLNLNYTVTANLIAFVISALLSIFVPKFIGIVEYGYWQLYVFYSSYVIFFQLGWLEGIYLKIGGEEYESLKKTQLGSQFWYFLIYQSIIGILIIIFAIVSSYNIEKTFILVMVGLITVISNIKLFCIYILQSTNRIKEYAKLSRNDKFLYFILISAYLMFGGRDFKILIILDLFSKLSITILGVYWIKDLINVSLAPFDMVTREIIINIKAGSSLMLASIANLFILGTSRLFVEKEWSIEVFGSLSFALSISNMFMLLMNSISTVLYPMLRREEMNKLPNLYKAIRNIFIPFAFGLLLFFYPGKLFLQWLLPEYKISLFYMGILFPMIAYEGRVSLLTNTYFKTLRKEKLILKINIITCILSIILSSISVFFFENIKLTVLSIIISLMFRSIVSEEILSRVLEIKLGYSNVLESIITIVFICSNMFIPTKYSFLLYLISYIALVMMYKNRIKSSVIFFTGKSR